MSVPRGAQYQIGTVIPARNVSQIVSTTVSRMNSGVQRPITYAESRHRAGSFHVVLARAMMPRPSVERYPAPGTGPANTCRSRTRSTAAHHRTTAAAAIASGIPARVIARAAADTVAVSAIENSTQPVTNTYPARYQAARHGPDEASRRSGLRSRFSL